MNFRRFASIVTPFFLSILFVLALVSMLATHPSSDTVKAEAFSSLSTIRYVATSGSDSFNECSNSDTPCRTIQHAVGVAQEGDEIHIAQGIYTGTMVTFSPMSDRYITATVIITKNIAAIRGGYSSDFTDHNPDANNTVLSAEDAPQKYVIFIEDRNTLIDGLAITGSNSDQNGAGIRINGGSPTISHNRIYGNTALRGAGIFAVDAPSPTIRNNRIYNNLATEAAAGIQILRGGGLIQNNHILSNTAESWAGGGMEIAVDAWTNVISNTIIGNTAHTGGGIALNWHVNSVITGNVILSNTATNGRGGGLYLGDESQALISQNHVTNNTAQEGSGISFSSGQFTLTHNLIQDNSSNYGGGINIIDGAAGLVAYNEIIGNVGGGVGGLRAYENGDLTITHNTIMDNISFHGGGGIDINAANMPASPFTVTHNVISGNQAQNWDGGGIFILNGATGLIAYNEIINNEAADHGGGIGTFNNGLLTIRNNDIHLNTATHGGGGIRVNAEGDESPLAIENNIIHTNTAEWGAGVYVNNTTGAVHVVGNDVRFNQITGETFQPGGISFDNTSGMVTVVNNVVANNDNRGVKGVNYAEIELINNTIVGNGSSAIEMHAWPITSTVPMTTTLINNIIADHPDCAFFGFYGAVFAVYHNDVVGHELEGCGAVIIAQSGNIHADPLFVDTVNGNFRLQAGSPAIDSGTAGVNVPNVDIEGTIRPQGSGIDMGAYEAIRYQLFLPSVISTLPNESAIVNEPLLDSWTTKAPMTTPRGLATAAVLSDTIFVIGGWVTQDTFIVEAYNPTMDSWSTKSSMTIPRNNLASAALNGKIYAIGGWSVTTNTTAVEVYDPINNSWSNVAPLPLPFGNNGLRATSANGKIYAFGGWDGRVVTNTVMIYDPDTDVWSFGMPMPTPRREVAVAAIDTQIYVMGGFDAISDTTTTAVTIYDTTLDSWSDGADMPEALEAGAAVVIDNMIYVVGDGMNMQYNPSTDSWKHMMPMPTARHALVAGNVDNVLYAIGGWPDEGEANINEAYYAPTLHHLYLPSIIKAN